MIRRELKFFVINGVISVAIAYGVYSGLIYSGVSFDVANGLAYLSGLTFGFFFNRTITFCDTESLSVMKLGRYTLLHAATLLVNVAVNSMMLRYLHGVHLAIFCSFLTAIAFSTVLNFFGLKYWVFN